MTWTVETLNDAVDRELCALPSAMRTRFARICELITAMTSEADLHRKWSENSEYRTEYERLGPEFALAHSVIEARTRAQLTQAELAERMATTQSVVARLESGRVSPSTRTLERVARTTGTQLRIHFDPA